MYAGAYIYGRSRHERYVDEQGRLRRRSRHLPMAEWSVLLRDHHPGYIDWATFQANQARIDAERSSPTSPSRRRGERRVGTAARPGEVWKVWPPAAHSLHGPKRLARLPLLRQGYRRGTRRVLSPCGRDPNRSSGGRGFPQGSDAGGPGSQRDRGPATRSRTTMPRWRSGVWLWSGLATRRNVRSVITVPSSPKTGS